MVIERSGPLEMLTILDLSEGIAGPYAAMLFGQLGATVIKVELPGQGDVSRAWGPVEGDELGPESSLTYQAVNACKMSLTLDYRTPEGAAILRRLAEDADGIIDSYPSRRDSALGLGGSELVSRIPRLVIVQVSGYGASGEYAERPLAGLTLAASTGVLPPDASGYVHDRGLEQILGQNVFLAALAGLWRATETEHGQVIDVGGMPALAPTGGGQVPGGSSPPVINLAELGAQGLLHDVDHPLLGHLEYPGAPFVMSATPAEPPSRAPLLGEHTNYVLEDLIGLEAAEVETLRSQDIV